MKTQLTDAPLIFSGPPSSFTDAVILGQGLPLEKDGIPIKYAWKESLHLGSFRDTRGVEHIVKPERVDKVIADYRRAFAKGYRPPIMLGHPVQGEAKDPLKSRGFIIDVRKNDKGNLEALHQFIGNDAIQDAARNKTSICILPNVTDENGEKYEQLIDHQALVPDPQLTSLSDFTPALAASRGATASAVVLTLATSPQLEVHMDLSKLREAINAGKDVQDDQLIQLAVKKLTDSTSELTLSKSAHTTAATELATMKTRAETAEASLATAQTKVLELSRAPDPGILADRADLMCQKIDLAMDKGQCTKAQADILKAALKDGDKPNLLMLSRSGASGTPIDVALKVLELNKAFTGSKSGTQHLPDPNDTKKEVVSPERKKEILAAAGM